MSDTYIVTGGASGTGRMVAARLKAAGNTVVVWGRNEDRLVDTVNSGDADSYAVVELSDPAQVDAAAASSASDEKIAGFIHCAGVWTPGDLADVPADALVAHINSVCLASALCMRKAAAMVRPNGGRILQIAAASGKPGFADTALNVLAKRSQDGLGEALTAELSGAGILVTTVYPDSIGPQDSDGVANGDAIGYGDLADVILFALNAPASAHVREVLVTSRNAER